MRRWAMLATVKSVLSHPVTLAQCKNFFARHAGVSAVECFDTAGAAKHVARSGDETLAAIRVGSGGAALQPG
ncbi:MAG: prephenate dehydratase domain-containing protein [Gemmatimonadota bacterium]